MARGAASRLSQPCQVNCMVIFVPRKPVKWMWSQAVFQSPMSGMYSIVTSVSRLVAEDLRHDPVLGIDLRRLVGRVVENHAVAVAEDVVADPAHDLQVALGEHRGEHGLHQRLAGLAVLAAVERPGRLGELVRARGSRLRGSG